MNVYILGIGGTLMCSVAKLAKHLGYSVGGYDNAVYPPASHWLSDAGILFDCTINKKAMLDADYVIVGNCMTRGDDVVEFCLTHRLAMVSAAWWLGEMVLSQKKVIAVSGTHGKTTVTALLSWMLERMDASPSFLVAGQPVNFSDSVSFNTQGVHFVIEGDEYDTCFFDKRSKFLHYRPDVLLINNLEFDHADIFSDLSAIQTQFSHLLRTMPAQAQVVYRADDKNVQELLDRGCWSKRCAVDFKHLPFTISLNNNGYYMHYGDAMHGPVRCHMFGAHQQHNIVMALHALHALGFDYVDCFLAMDGFLGVKRRMELVVSGSVRVYSDFAHHPTSVAAVIASANLYMPYKRLHVVFFVECNTLKNGLMCFELARALNGADCLWLFQSERMKWRWERVTPVFSCDYQVFDVKEALAAQLLENVQEGDCVVVMSNGNVAGFLAMLDDGLKS